jgi:peptidoglycan/LPS O-acetylase OafA/YrhL
MYKYQHVIIVGFDDWDLFFRKQVSTRLDSIMYGVVGAFIQYYYQEKWLKYKKELLIIGIALLLLSKFIIPRYATIGSFYNAV